MGKDGLGDPGVDEWIILKRKVKLSHYIPWRHMWGEEVQLLLILNLGSRWG
jgi:hypothetical protein